MLVIFLMMIPSLALGPPPPPHAASCRSGVIPPCVFEVPPGYTVLGSKQRDTLREEEEDLLQFAIQQSLLEAGSEHDQVGWSTCFLSRETSRSRRGEASVAAWWRRNETALL